MFNMYSWNKSQGCFRDVAFKFLVNDLYLTAETSESPEVSSGVGSSTVWLCPNTFI